MIGQLSGSLDDAFLARNVLLTPDQQLVTRGTIAWFDSSDDAARGFCRDCGTPLAYRFKGIPRIAMTIGSLDDLNAASKEDISKFFRQYYTPNNASLCIAGDFDPKEARARRGQNQRSRRQARSRRDCARLRHPRGTGGDWRDSAGD